VSAGVVFGERRTPFAEAHRHSAEDDPRSTMERILLGALQRSPCVVAFSGGRDSSAALAEATRVARAHGLEDPVPHTLRFGDAPRTAEDEWQELVIRHLGLENWSRRIVTDELDALGPIALDVIRRYGVHWPPNVHTFQLLLEPARGGALITGNGGDELFSPWAGHRIALLRRGRAFPRRYDVRPLMLYLLPTALLVRRSIRRGHYRLPWLAPGPAAELQRTFAAGSVQLEKSWADALEDYLSSRYLEVGNGFTGAMARDAGVALVEPFFDPSYVRSVAATAPAEGYGSRTAAMESLFGDLLPPQVSGRSTKAVFTEVFAGPQTRLFAEQWTGAGVDPSLVEPEVLRDVWLAPVIDIRSLVPIQAAWLASA
jgi:asparagine synthase (glutamine-hydrolysing)